MQVWKKGIDIVWYRIYLLLNALNKTVSIIQRFEATLFTVAAWEFVKVKM